MRFYGELLIFILLLITNARVLFIKKAKRDSLVVLAPLTLLLSIIQFFAFGVNSYTVAGFILAVLVFFSNFHGMFRYSEQLVVDHYSILMKFWSAITTILSVAVIAVAIFFAPIEYSSNKLGITETVLRYKGSFRAGFEPASNFSVTNAVITEFTKVPELPSRRDVVVVVPDKRGDTWYYKPYLQLLSKEGYTVVSADFYTSDIQWVENIWNNKYSRRYVMVIKSLANNFKFMSQKEFYTYNITQELEALIPLLSQRYGENCRYFFITDVMANTAVEDFMKMHPEKVTGSFAIDTIEEYKTPGYGIVTQTDPLLTTLLQQKKDRAGFYTRYMVLKSKQAINEAWGIKK